MTDEDTAVIYPSSGNACMATNL